MRMSVAATACLLAGVALSTPCLGQETPKLPIVTDPIYTKPPQMVGMDHGRRMNLYCRGSGSPSVIFDSGWGDSTISWALVQPALAKRSRTCSYDRAGLGFSDAATHPGTANNMAEDLHALLQGAHVKPPYILVGHLVAGMTMRVFANRYRSDVVGMVVVEGSHEDQSTRSWAIEAPDSKEKWDAGLKDTSCIDAAKGGFISKGTPAYAKCVGDDDPRYSRAINEAMLGYGASLKWQLAFASERQNMFYASADQTCATRKDFSDMPIIVLTHSPYPRNKNWTQEVQDQHTLIWEDMHTQIAAMSTPRREHDRSEKWSLRTVRPPKNRHRRGESGGGDCERATRELTLAVLPLLQSREGRGGVALDLISQIKSLTPT